MEIHNLWMDVSPVFRRRAADPIGLVDLSVKSSPLKSSVILTAVSVGSSLLGLVTQLLLARSFGAGLSIDAYFAGLSLPQLVGGIASAAITYQIVPALIHCREVAGEHEVLALSLRYYAARWSLGLIALGIMISWFVIEHLPNGAAYVHHSARIVAVVGWISVWCGIQTALLTAICHSRGQFLAAAGLNWIPNIFAMLACWTIILKGGTPLYVALALCAGHVTSLILLRWRAKAEVDRKLLSHRFDVVRNEIKGAPYIILSMSVFTLYGAVDAYWGGHLGEGAVTSLAYGQRLIVAVAGLAVTGASIVMLPRFSELAAIGDMKLMMESTVRACRAVVTLTGILAVAVGIFTLPTIEFLFGGQMFAEEDVHLLAELMPFLLVGMVPMSASTVLFRALYAVRDMKGAGIVGVSGALVYVILSGWLVKSGCGIAAFGYAYSATWTLVVTLCLCVFLRRFGVALLTPANITWSVQLAAALGSAAVCGHIIRAIMIDAAAMPRIAELIIGYATTGVSFCVFSFVFGMHEPMMLIAGLRERARR